ncbi:hypothetical protein QQZ08_005979 [Neonectria magnoliae]|uniref:Uncharacterized protein n=1 Tax=Neonectria magnoliae TaxID=2732573 RepID=A0ABR1I2F5_9HYPO
MNVKDGNSDIYSFCAEYHLCTFPGCEDRRVRRNGEDLQFCNHHRCEHDSCRNGKDRGAFCRAHTCGDTHCISFVRGGDGGDPERFCERHRRCLKPQCGRFCHVRENGLPSPFCGAHYCEFADCGNERDSAAHCGEHTCVEPGCAKGRESPKGLYCKEHGCRTKGCTLRRFGREHYYYDGFPGLDNNVRCPHDAERHGRYCECPHCEREAARARTFEHNRSHKCAVGGCPRARKPGCRREALLCDVHACAQVGCPNRVVEDTAWCFEHARGGEDVRRRRRPDWGARLREREAERRVGWGGREREGTNPWAAWGITM